MTSSDTTTEAGSATSSDVFAARRERVRAKLAEKGLDALLVAHAANRFYLSGFELHDPQCNESAGMLLIHRDGRDVLLTDPRYEDAAKRLWAADAIHIYRAPRDADINAFLKGQNCATMGVESDALSHRTWESLSDGLPFTPATGIVEGIRLFKDAAEIEAMRRSCALNHAAFSAAPGFLVPGRSEYEVSWELEKYFREHGATELSFSTIVGVNQNAALPHAIPGHTAVPESGLVLIDMGCRLDDYCSDQTRTFWVGDTPSDRFRHVVDMVREAQDAALKIIRPGLLVRDAYLAARAVFERYGQERFFTHALGHGIGLQTHEPPSLAPTASDILQPGMVVTVEPGLYYPEWGGVRWEYMVCVTQDGHDVL
ncbi:peptidase M24 [Desulfovibrio sp. X2]|uniref:M24 family metallopeptidase n=1 Tax=Desulfovibrio sp. X2 TaxID=941449 RepID=UPI000358A7F5|nr:Xaa-Pro peptidase family protein [Desulfovibrio sp. X2]EPR44226.1 peptidase M24 [Desulfovibrio sp. X2]